MLRYHKAQLYSFLKSNFVIPGMLELFGVSSTKNWCDDLMLLRCPTQCRYYISQDLYMTLNCICLIPVGLVWSCSSAGRSCSTFCFSLELEGSQNALCLCEYLWIVLDKTTAEVILIVISRIPPGGMLSYAHSALTMRLCCKFREQY